jgi:hypothetical protein
LRTKKKFRFDGRPGGEGIVPWPAATPGMIEQAYG